MIRSLIGVNNIDNYVIFYLMCPTPLPTSRSAKIIEYISRVNFDDCFGAFVYDFKDSLVGYHFAFFIDKDMTDFDTYFTRSFQFAIDKMDFYMPGLFFVGFGDKEPSLAMNQLEFETDPTLN